MTLCSVLNKFVSAVQSDVVWISRSEAAASLVENKLEEQRIAELERLRAIVARKQVKLSSETGLLRKLLCVSVLPLVTSGMMTFIVIIVLDFDETVAEFHDSILLGASARVDEIAIDPPDW